MFENVRHRMVSENDSIVVSKKSSQLPPPAAACRKMFIGFDRSFCALSVVASELERFREEFGGPCGNHRSSCDGRRRPRSFSPVLRRRGTQVGTRRLTLMGPIVTIVISVLMLAVVPPFSWEKGSTFTLYPNWQWLITDCSFRRNSRETLLSLA